MRLLVPMILAALSGSVVAQTQYDHLVAHTATSTFSKFNDGSRDAAGNTYMLGILRGGVEIDGTSVSSIEDDVIVVKYDPEGAVLWWRTLHTSWFDFLTDHVLDDAGNIYVSVFMNGNSPTISGSGMDDLPFMPNAGHVVVVFGPDGVYQGMHAVPQPTWIAYSGDTLYRLVGSSGSIIQATDLEGQVLWSVPTQGIVSARGIVVSDDGAAVYAVGGISTSLSCQDSVATSTNGAGVGVVKLSNEGTCEWVRIIAPAAINSFTRAAVLARADGGLCIATENGSALTFGGSTLNGGGSAQGHVFNLAADGSELWGAAVYSSATDVYALARNGSDICLLTRVQNQATIGDSIIQAGNARSAALVRYDAGGELQFLDVSLRGQTHETSAMTVLDDGTYVLGGLATGLRNTCDTIFHGTALYRAAFTEESALVTNPPVITGDAGGLEVITDGAVPYTYAWFHVDELIPGATQSIHVPTVNGPYHATITNPWGCSASSNSIMVTSVGVDEAMPNGALSIYPLPATDRVTMRWQEVAGTAIVQVFDAMGRQLLDTQAGGGTYAMDVSAWPEGTYIVRFASGGMMHHRRMVVRR